MYLAVVIATHSLPCVSLAESVFVWLDDGRVLTGEVDARTDEEHLWLRTSSKSFVLATSVEWTQVKAVRAAGKQLTRDDFGKRVDEFKSEPPEDHLAERKPAVLEHGTTIVEREHARRNAATRVTTLDVEAHLANWDRDAEIDGVEIRIAPRNVFGEIVPVSGQLLAALVGRNQLAPHDRAAYPRLGRWSLRTDTNDFGHYGAIYRMPFRTSHPDEFLSIEPHGLIDATLFVFGQGRFEADATIHLRRFNPVRDDMRRHRHARDR
jgi:hypothetical protein